MKCLLQVLVLIPGLARAAGISITVSGEPPRFRAGGSAILGRLNNPNLHAIFQVTAAQRPQQPIAGTYQVDDGVLIFLPKEPLEPGATYHAVFSLLTEKAALDYTAPQPVTPATTMVEQVYPSAPELPVNQLKCYVHFSAPMSRGETRKRVHLIEEGAGEINLPAPDADEELWDRDLRRLTIVLDPGRIAGGAGATGDGAARLTAGKRYKLVIDRQWPDAAGLPLKQGFVKEFSAVAADHAPLDPKQWTLAPPAADSRAALVLTFPESLDAALLLRFIDVVGPNGKPVSGKVSLGDHETKWIFAPAQAWAPGKYSLEVLSTLEDLAGNKIGASPQAPVGDTVTIPFEIAR